MKKALFAVAVVIVVIQFIRPSRNLSTEPPGPHDLTVMYPAPAEVKTILAKACYDCHSNNTRYPWYANVQPVGWWLTDHVNEGKEHLNFNAFGTYSARRQAHELKGIIHELEEGGMPLASYKLIHTDARLTDAESKTLINWIESIRARMPPS